MLSHNIFISAMHKVRRKYLSGFLVCEIFFFDIKIFHSSSGESAFHSMMHGFGWARHPMLRRMHNVRHDKPITLLYGSRSWIDKSSWDLLKAARESNYVNVQVRCSLNSLT